MISRLLPSGRLFTRVYRDGVLLDEWAGKNLVVDAGSAVLANLLGGVTLGNSISQIGFGASTAAVSPGNMGLSPGAFVKAIDATSFPSPGSVAFSISLGPFEANGLPLAEYGLLTANGALFARLVRTASLVKNVTITLSSVWTITF